MRHVRMVVPALILLLVSNSLSPLASMVAWKKSYIFNQEVVGLNGKIEPVFAQEASNAGLLKKIIGYKKKGKISLDSKKNMTIFAFDKSKMKDLGIAIRLSSGKDQTIVHIDDDGDERMLGENKLYSSPMFLSSKDSFDYEIDSKDKDSLEAKANAILVDTSKFKEKLTISPDIVDAADSSDDVVSRKYWGADETLRYADHPTWVAYYDKIANQPVTSPTKEDQKIANIRNYLATKFSFEDTPVSTQRYENGHKLVWPIEKTKRVEKIVIHHTAEALDNDSRNDTDIIRGIYYYHAMVRGWGDIGYNYIVGRDGKIYQGRAGGDYAVAAHNLWNNKSTVGISVLGNFESSNIGNDQKAGVERAVGLMAKKYGIDINGQSISHKECSATDGCSLLKDYMTPNLVGHRDGGYTSCPGKNLYALIPDFRFNGKMHTTGLKYKDNPDAGDADTGIAKGPMIKIRLSYTGETVDLSSYTPEKVKISYGTKSGYANLKNYHFEKRGNDQIALVVGNKTARIPYLTLSSTVMQVDSWNRKPSWDSSGKINDNKFRGSITIRNDNGKLILINELPLEDYLKGIAEIANDESPEKAKTILVAARSYALWYTSPANRKFPGKPYDGSDNPDEFQKYMGYSYEMRSSNIGQYVDDTNSQVIKFNGQLIKPWYFNQSNGKTKSYTEYCEERKTNGSYDTNMTCNDIPYLQSVYDPAGIIDGGYKGHGVGISGAGAKYLADMEGKKYDEIIQYFLKGVTIGKIDYNNGVLANK